MFGKRFSGMLTVVLLLTAGVAAATDDPPRLEYEKYTLPNGLDVILHEDHTIPMVSVNIWYHVGSKNEKAGRTGFAHLFEHMMFQGSANCATSWPSTSSASARRSRSRWTRTARRSR